MLIDKTSVWKDSKAQQLSRALILINSDREMQNFLRDALTEKEIMEISSRLEAAIMLQSGSKYTEVITKTNLSSRTVARISEWMQKGCGGYATIIAQINKHHTHTLPERAA